MGNEGKLTEALTGQVSGQRSGDRSADRSGGQPEAGRSVRGGQCDRRRLTGQVRTDRPTGQRSPDREGVGQ